MVTPGRCGVHKPAANVVTRPSWGAQISNEHPEQQRMGHVMKITPWLIGDEVPYSIGGGSAVAMGSAGNMQSIQVGGGWNNNLVCGNKSMTNTLENQLNGTSTLFALMITCGCIKNHDWG